jgi:hypothetical protein
MSAAAIGSGHGFLLDQANGVTDPADLSRSIAAVFGETHTELCTTLAGHVASWMNIFLLILPDGWHWKF